MEEIKHVFNKIKNFSYRRLTKKQESSIGELILSEELKEIKLSDNIIEELKEIKLNDDVIEQIKDFNHWSLTEEQVLIN